MNSDTLNNTMGRCDNHGLHSDAMHELPLPTLPIGNIIPLKTMGVWSEKGKERIENIREELYIKTDDPKSKSCLIQSISKAV